MILDSIRVMTVSGAIVDCFPFTRRSLAHLGSLFLHCHQGKTSRIISSDVMIYSGEVCAYKKYIYIYIYVYTCYNMVSNTHDWEGALPRNGQDSSIAPTNGANSVQVQCKTTSDETSKYTHNNHQSVIQIYMYYCKYKHTNG